MTYCGNMIRRTTGVVAVLILTCCALSVARQAATDSAGPLEVTSLLGRKLYALPDDGSIKTAQQNLAADPKNVSLVLKLSLAQAARRQYREAVATCTSGLTFAPNNAILLVERGHRELGLRDFKTAATDLNQAVAADPKLIDEYYHLGLAQYFMRDFSGAAEFFNKGLSLAQNNDTVIDYSNWLYASLRRAGQTEEAARVLARITPDMTNKEPHIAFYLKLLRFYQGALPESQILPPKPATPNDIEGELQFNTVSYGVGNWHLYNGDPARARQLFEPVVTGYAWNSWGFIGSEVELAKSAGR